MPMIVIKPAKDNKKLEENGKMKFKFIGIGAAGNKAALELVNSGVVDTDSVVLINSTNKDIPKDFNGTTIIISETNSGCGKERKIAKEYAIETMKKGVLDQCFSNEDSVLIMTSVEGGTGSGSTPVIASYCAKVLGLNVHIVAFTGFEEDVRGIENTVEFFKEIQFECDVMTIRNSAFLVEARNNKFEAEKLANKELASRVNILLGTDLIDSAQNIDDTDIYKVVSTTGYKTIEKRVFQKDLVDVSDFNKICKQMIYDSKSLKTKEPGELRLGVILNIKPESEDAVDYKFSIIKDAYGMPYECFHHMQYNGKEQYIAFIASGMKMPLEEVTEIYNRYKEATSQVDKKADSFFDTISGFSKESEDDKFDMIRSSERPASQDKADFFKNL